jgi:hypothetical protein
VDEIHPQQTEKRPLIAAFSFGANKKNGKFALVLFWD